MDENVKEHIEEIQIKSVNDIRNENKILKSRVRKQITEMDRSFPKCGWCNKRHNLKCQRIHIKFI